MCPDEGGWDVKDAARKKDRGGRAARTAEATEKRGRDEEKEATEVSTKKAKPNTPRVDETARIRRPRGEAAERAKEFVALLKKNDTELKDSIKSQAQTTGAAARGTRPVAKEAAKETPKTARPAVSTNVPPVVAAKENTAALSPPAPRVASVPSAAARVEKVPQNKKEVKMTPAQTISDDAAWEEIMPMMDDLLAEEVKASVNANQEEVFRRRCEKGPFAAVVKGHFLTGLKLRTGEVKDLALRSLALSTVKAHKRMLRFLSNMPEKYHQLNLDRAMEQYFLEVKSVRRWLPTTMMVKMATAHGALRLLPLYTEGELPVLMRESVTWMSAMKAAAKMAKQHPPTQPTAATWKEVEEAISKETQTSVKMALLITWLTCGRGGDVLLLKPSDVEITTRPSKEGHAKVMSVGFWKGKTVKTRGSYTVFTQAPPQAMFNQWQEYHKSVGEQKYLFRGVKGSQIKDALRRANPKLEQRSLRRGAIQALAATNLKDEELLHYSGHTNVTMLRRYLNFGKVSGEGTRLASQALALVQ